MMRFKEFVKLTEEDKGLMGFGTPVRNRKPSDGQPFKDQLSSVAGDKGGGGGMGGGGMGPMGPMMGAPGPQLGGGQKPGGRMFLKKTMNKR